ncbi:MAG: hypothetical protein Q4F33_00465 [Mycoplasmatota bacterium]|nr:hypothetical protein [Mycoplasmatota bacterium]
MSKIRNAETTSSKNKLIISKNFYKITITPYIIATNGPLVAKVKTACSLLPHFINCN